MPFLLESDCAYPRVRGNVEMITIQYEKRSEFYGATGLAAQYITSIITYFVDDLYKINSVGHRAKT